MRSGRDLEDAGIEEGQTFLPVYSVETREEAKMLIVMTCSRGLDGEYYAPGLADKQTLERLYGFGHRLDQAYQRLLTQRRLR